MRPGSFASAGLRRISSASARCAAPHLEARPLQRGESGGADAAGLDALELRHGGVGIARASRASRRG